MHPQSFFGWGMIILLIGVGAFVALEYIPRPN
jgi:hypothetical protein